MRIDIVRLHLIKSTSRLGRRNDPLNHVRMIRIVFLCTDNTQLALAVS